MKHSLWTGMSCCIAIALSAVVANAFTLTDTIKDESGSAVNNASVSLLGKGLKFAQSANHPVEGRFPVRWCTQSGGHIWDHKDPGQNQSWVPKTTWDFFNKF